MSLLRTRNYMSAILAIAMLASSAASAAPAPNTINPYTALSVLSGSTAAAEAAATQEPYDSTPHGTMMPLWVALGVVFAGWAWFALDNNGNNNGNNSPISPA